MQVPFSVSGTAVAPSVHLSTSCLSFGSLQAGTAFTKAVYIHNKADLPIYFEFMTDPLGVFAFDRVRGSVDGSSSAHVTVTFQPKEASNFWRQVTCLIRVSHLLSKCASCLLLPSGISCRPPVALLLPCICPLLHEPAEPTCQGLSWSLMAS